MKIYIPIAATVDKLPNNSCVSLSLSENHVGPNSPLVAIWTKGYDRCHIFSTMKMKVWDWLITYIHTYMHACMHAWIHTCIHTYIHRYIHSYIHTYIHTCLLLLISMLWHRQAIFDSKGDKLSSFAECRIRTHQGLRHQITSRLNARWQTDWAVEDQAKKLELDSPSLWSASIQPTRPNSRLAFAPGSGDIHVCCC